MMRLFMLILSFTFLMISARSQELRRNTIFLELGGATYFYSLNYDYLFFKNPDINLSGRVGYMYLNLFNYNSREMHGIPVGFSLLKRIGKNYLEAGFSGSVIFDDYIVTDQNIAVVGTVSELIIVPSFRAGIRHQPLKKKIFWNALAQISHISVYDRNTLESPEVHTLPFLSLGIGYSFK